MFDRDLAILSSKRKKLNW